VSGSKESMLLWLRAAQRGHTKQGSRCAQNPASEQEKDTNGNGNTSEARLCGDWISSDAFVGAAKPQGQSL